MPKFMTEIQSKQKSLIKILEELEVLMEEIDPKNENSTFVDAFQGLEEAVEDMPKRYGFESVWCNEEYE